MELAPFSVYKDCVSGVWVCTSCKFNQSGLKKLVSCCFWWKSLNFVKFLAGTLWHKNSMKKSRQCILSLNVKSTIFSWKMLLNFIKTGEILVKISEKSKWNQRNSLYFLESLNLDISLSKTKIKKIFLIPYSTLDKLSNDTSLNSLRWIYRSAKIDWTKKKPSWVYSSSPPPQEGSEQKTVHTKCEKDQKWEKFLQTMSRNRSSRLFKNFWMVPLWQILTSQNLPDKKPV